jgi:hypothetical protein
MEMTAMFQPPKEWMVRSADGAIWPPGFVPSTAAQVGGKAQPSRRSKAPATPAAAQRLQLRPDGRQGCPAPDARIVPFAFHAPKGAVSMGQTVWQHLRRNGPDAQISDREAAAICKCLPCDIRVRMKPSVNAGVLTMTKRGPMCLYRVGPTVPKGFAA